MFRRFAEEAARTEKTICIIYPNKHGLCLNGNGRQLEYSHDDMANQLSQESNQKSRKTGKRIY